MTEDPVAIADLIVGEHTRTSRDAERLLLAMQRLEEAELLLRGRIRARMKLGSSDYAALRLIVRAERNDDPARPRDLARLLGISGAAATAVCERLERAAFITRTPDATDGRGRVLLVSESARAHLDEALAATEDHINALLRAIGHAETERLVGLLTDVTAALDTGAHHLDR